MRTEKSEPLPIEAFKKQIMACDYHYIIIDGDTGSGKSTQVPQWFHETGQSVLVTEPLTETVIGTAEYVQQTLGSVVGYQTAQYRSSNTKNDVLYCTDGLALVRELAKRNRYDVLIIDELHQWNTNQSTLEAWAWKGIKEGTSLFKKIVILSATLQAKELSSKREYAPIFKVPGRQFQIEERPKGSSLVSDIKSLIKEGCDILCFQPGKAEIEKVVRELSLEDAEIIPFHGMLEREEKDKAYRSYNRPKVIISTNALETGRTVVPSPGKTLAVVDSGMERRVELENGIECLRLHPISKAQTMQRRGRTGRTGKGIFINWCTERQEEFPTPEIQRTRLDQTVLRLACAGYAAEELPFFHPLKPEELKRARKSLVTLGAMNEDGTVTTIGRTMARLPLSVQYARMVVEAEKYGVVQDVATIASILECGSLRDRTDAWKAHTKEKDSDLLAELDVYNAAKKLPSKELRNNGIFSRSFFKVKDVVRSILSALSGTGVAISTEMDREAIKKACVSGMVGNLYQKSYSGDYNKEGDCPRTLSRESVIGYPHPEWVVGEPLSISFTNKRGRQCGMELLTLVTKVTPELLQEVAPQLTRKESGVYPEYDYNQDVCTSVTRTYFHKTEVSSERVPDKNHPDAAKVFASWVANKVYYGGNSLLQEVCNHNKRVTTQTRNLNERAGKEVFLSPADEPTMSVWVKTQLSGAACMKDIGDITSLMLPELDPIQVKAIEEENPDIMIVDGVSCSLSYLPESVEITFPQGDLSGVSDEDFSHITRRKIFARGYHKEYSVEGLLLVLKKYEKDKEKERVASELKKEATTIAEAALALVSRVGEPYQILDNVYYLNLEMSNSWVGDYFFLSLEERKEYLCGEGYPALFSAWVKAKYPDKSKVFDLYYMCPEGEKSLRIKYTEARNRIDNKETLIKEIENW